MPLSTELIFLQQVRDATNTTLDIIITGIDANVAAAYAQANLAISEITAAYNQANAAINQANIVYGQANAAYTQANAAFNAANTVNVRVTTVSTVANNAANTANLALSEITAAYNEANTANSLANQAFTAANLASTRANTALTDAISAESQASAANNNALLAYGQANAAYAEANTAFATATQTVITGQTVGDGSGYKTSFFTVDARGRVTSAGAPIIPIFTGTVAGLVPTSTNNPNLFLNGDGNFAAITGSLANTLLSGTGYAQFQNGLMIQWGVVALNTLVAVGSQSTIVSYPKTFTSGAFVIMATPNGTTNDGDSYTTVSAQIRNQTSFTLWFRGVNTIGELGNAFWIAIGV